MTQQESAFPISLEEFREFLKANPGPYKPSVADECPLAKALEARGLHRVIVGANLSFWDAEASDSTGIRSFTSQLPQWAQKFRDEYDYAGKTGYDPEGRFLRIEGIKPLDLLNRLFPVQPAAPVPPEEKPNG